MSATQIKTQITYGGANVLATPPVRINMEMTTSDDADQSAAARYGYYAALERETKMLVDAVSEATTRDLSTKVAEYAGKLEGLAELLHELVPDHPDGDEWMAETIRQLAGWVDAKSDESEVTYRSFEDTSATLVEVHQLDHERMKLAEQATFAYLRWADKLGTDGPLPVPPPPRFDLPRATHLRMHDALGLDHDHPYPNPFDFPTEADAEPDGAAGNGSTYQPNPAEVPTHTIDVTADDDVTTAEQPETEIPTQPTLPRVAPPRAAAPDPED